MKLSGYNDGHHLLLIKEPGEAIIALRNELLKHKEIYAYASLGNSFEDCLARIAEKLDVVLDGSYDADELCAMLVTALRNKHAHPNQPHLRVSGLQSVEIIERKGTISLEKGEDINTIAPIQNNSDALRNTMLETLNNKDYYSIVTIKYYSTSRPDKGESILFVPWPKNAKSYISTRKLPTYDEVRPVVPVINGIALTAFITDNNFLWDMNTCNFNDIPADIYLNIETQISKVSKGYLGKDQS